MQGPRGFNQYQNHHEILFSNDDRPVAGSENLQCRTLGSYDFSYSSLGIGLGRYLAGTTAKGGVAGGRSNAVFDDFVWNLVFADCNLYWSFALHIWNDAVSVAAWGEGVGSQAVKDGELKTWA